MSDQSSASDEGKDKGVDENSEKNGGKGLNSQRTSGSSSSDGAGTKVVSKFLKTNSDEKISAASVKQNKRIKSKTTSSRNVDFPLPEPGVGIKPPHPKSDPTGRPLKKFSDPLKPQGNRTQIVINEEERFKYQRNLKKDAEYKDVRGPSKKWQNFPKGDRLTRQGLNPAKSMADVSSKPQKQAALRKGISHAKSTMNLRGSNATDEDSNASLSRDKRCSTQVDISGITSHGASLRASDDPFLVEQRRRLTESLTAKKKLILPCGPLPGLRRRRIPDDQLTAKDLAARERTKLHKERQLAKLPCKVDKTSSPDSTTTKPRPCTPSKCKSDESREKPSAPPPPPRIPVIVDNSSDMEGFKNFLKLSGSNDKQKAVNKKNTSLSTPIQDLNEAMASGLSSLYSKVKTGGILSLKDQNPGPWGPTKIEVREPIAKISIPEDISRKIKAWNSGDLPNQEESAVIREINNEIQRQLLKAMMTAVRRGLHSSQMQVFPETMVSQSGLKRDVLHVKPSDWPRVPDIESLMNNILMDFASEVGNSRRMPFIPLRDPSNNTTVAEPPGDDDPDDPDDGINIQTKSQYSKSTDKNLVAAGEKSDFKDSDYAVDPDERDDIIESSELRGRREEFGRQFIGQNRHNRWGNAFGIALWNGDGLSVLAHDYTDNVVDAAGLRIEELMSSQHTLPRVAFVPTFISRLMNEIDFGNPQFNHLIDRLRFHADRPDLIYFPIHNIENSHWILVEVNIPDHSIRFFDPFQNSATLGQQALPRKKAKTGKNIQSDQRKAAVAAVITRALQTIRQFIQYVYPNVMDWRIPYPAWPQNETSITLDDFAQQDGNRDCGPIILFAMERLSGLWTTLDPQDAAGRRDLAENGAWWYVRVRHFQQFHEEIARYWAAELARNVTAENAGYNGSDNDQGKSKPSTSKKP